MPDENATKKLSKVIGTEKFLKLTKCSVKFMKSGKTYSSQGSNYRLFTIKPIKEKECDEEIQFHIRININEFGEDAGLLDVDFYVKKSEWDAKMQEEVDKPTFDINKVKTNRTTPIRAKILRLEKIRKDNLAMKGELISEEEIKKMEEEIEEEMINQRREIFFRAEENEVEKQQKL